MKTNVSIELNDEQRTQLAYWIDSQGGVWPNQRKRMATRKEVVALCQQHIGGLAEAINGQAEKLHSNDQAQPTKGAVDLLKADPEDIPLMAKPNNPSYVRGWNQVKRSKR